MVEVITGDMEYYQNAEYPNKEVKQRILELVEDMNEYAKERIIK